MRSLENGEDDWVFHRALISACGSRNLLALHSAIYDKSLRYQMLVLTFRGKSVARGHKQLFDAALTRVCEKAEKILRLHVE